MAILYDAVGSVSFLRLDGDLDYPGTTLADITREGADGVGLRKSALRPKQTTLRGRRDVADELQAKLYVDTEIPSLRGTIVNIRLRGQNHQNFAVLDARVLSRRRVGKSVGSLTSGDPLYLIDCEFTVIYAGVP